MDIAENAETLVKKRNRLELWVAGFAIAIPASVLIAHKYWLHSHFPDRDLLLFLLLTLGLPLAPFFLWAVHLKGKLALLLGNAYKDDLKGEVMALLNLNDQKLWALYKHKNKICFIAEFFAIGQISLAYATFAYYA